MQFSPLLADYVISLYVLCLNCQKPQNVNLRNLLSSIGVAVAQ